MFRFFPVLAKLVFVASDVTPKSFNPIRSQYSRNLRQPLFIAKQVWTWVIKRSTLIFNTFCMNVAKQVALFCCPFYRTLKSAAHSLKVSLVFRTSTSRHNTLFPPSFPFALPSPPLSLKLCLSIDFNVNRTSICPRTSGRCLVLKFLKMILSNIWSPFSFKVKYFLDLTIDDCLTVTIDGSKRTNHWLYTSLHSQ